MKGGILIFWNSVPQCGDAEEDEEDGEEEGREQNVEGQNPNTLLAPECWIRVRSGNVEKNYTCPSSEYSNV